MQNFLYEGLAHWRQVDCLEEQGKLISKDLVMDKISQALLHEEVLRVFLWGMLSIKYLI